MTEPFLAKKNRRVETIQILQVGGGLVLIGILVYPWVSFFVIGIGLFYTIHNLLFVLDGRSGFNQQKEFENQLLNLLNAQSEELTNYLKILISSAGVTPIDIQVLIFEEDFTKRFPVGFKLYKGNREVAIKSVDDNIRDSIESIEQMNKLYPLVFERIWVRKGVELIDFAVELFMYWFSDQWILSNGKHFPNEATIKPLNTTTVFDLKTRKYRWRSLFS